NRGRPGSARWAARPAGSCGTPRPRAGTPARPHRRRATGTAGRRRAGRGRCWPAPHPLPSWAPARPTPPAPARPPTRRPPAERPRRSARSQSDRASQVRRSLGNLVERGVAVDLVGRRREERILLLRAARGDVTGADDTDRHPFLAPGVDVAGVAQRRL